MRMYPIDTDCPLFVDPENIHTWLDYLSDDTSPPTTSILQMYVCIPVPLYLVPGTYLLHRNHPMHKMHAVSPPRPPGTPQNGNSGLSHTPTLPTPALLG